MFNRHYQDELAFLRAAGRTFAEAHPDAARHLAEAGADPDVERLLEGVAFLTGRIRGRLDDGLPEISHGLMDAVLPHYLRPIPSLTLVQFQPGANQKETVVIPAGAALDAVPIDGTQCRFRTVHAVPVAPLAIVAIEVEPGPPTRVALRLRCAPGTTPAGLRLGRVRLHVGGDLPVARALHLCLGRHDGLVAEVDGRRVPGRLTLDAAGFDPAESLLPHPETAAGAHRLLLEWFAFPARFLALDLGGLDTVALPAGATALTIAITIERHARHLPPVDANALLLHTVPAVNLFEAEADPVVLDGTREAVPVRPSGGDPRHLAVYAVTGVAGHLRGSTTAIPFVRRLHRHGSTPAGTWQERRRPSVVGNAAEVDLLAEAPPGVADPIVLSLTLLATNGSLAARIGLGELSRSTRDVPAGITFRNLGVPTPPVEPALSGDLHWRLLAHLGLDYTSALSVDGLRTLVGLYDLRSRHEQGARHAHQRLLESIAAVHSERTTRHLDGVPIRGLAVTVELDEDRLGGIGDAWAFGAVLDGVVAQAVTLNAFTRLTVRCRRSGDGFTWPDRLGRRKLL